MSKISLQINIHTLRIADIDTGSAVGIGNNYFCDWRTYSKVNNGFGRIIGDRNSLSDGVSMVDDSDWQDMLCNEGIAESALRKLLR